MSGSSDNNCSQGRPLDNGPPLDVASVCLKSWRLFIWRETMCRLLHARDIASRRFIFAAWLITVSDFLKFIYFI